jgi:hypothetical protein
MRIYKSAWPEFSGSNLRKRIEGIMSNRMVDGLAGRQVGVLGTNTEFLKREFGVCQQNSTEV